MTTSTNVAGPGGYGETIAATFADRNSAKTALTDLHEAGYRTVWLGVTHGDPAADGGTTVASDDGGGMMESLGRFFSGDGAHEQALHQALMAHGLTDAEALRLEASIPAGAAIVTVDGENDPAGALVILRANGGEVSTGAAAPSPMRDVAARTSAPPAAMAAAPDADDARRLQLREERLRIDKQRVSRGEARIGKEVVTQQQSVDVPVFHEELFIQRRPVAPGSAVSTAPIGASEEIRIPLSAERVDVRKDTVVTEEVTIGKRAVEDTQHVSETVRHEELRVDDAAAAGRATSPRERT